MVYTDIYTVSILQPATKHTHIEQIFLHYGMSNHKYKAVEEDGEKVFLAILVKLQSISLHAKIIICSVGWCKMECGRNENPVQFLNFKYELYILGNINDIYLRI